MEVNLTAASIVAGGAGVTGAAPRLIAMSKEALSEFTGLPVGLKDIKDLFSRKGLGQARTGGSLWSSRPPGVQVRQFGDIWVKRVNPESNSLMQWWGQKSINAQYRGLQALGDMATPSTMRNGMLFTRSVGETLPDGFRLLNSASRGAYLQGSRRMGTYFNDIQPRNMGTNGLIFDPAIDPVTKALFWGVAGAAAYGAYELSD